MGASIIGLKKMVQYYILVEGNNYLLDFDGNNQIIGFYTTLYLNDEFEFIDEILHSIKHEMSKILNDNHIQNNNSFCSYYYIKEISKIEKLTNEMDGKGFSFYRMSKLQILTSTINYYLKLLLIRLEIINRIHLPFKLID